MDQRTITLCLARKGRSAVEVHAAPVARLGYESAGYPSAMHYLRQAEFAT
jgi:hypothetical protein